MKITTKLTEAVLHEEQRFKVNLNHPAVKSRAAQAPAWMTLLRRVIKNGDGTVVIKHEENGEAGVAGSSMDALLGLTFVPKAALTPVAGA